MRYSARVTTRDNGRVSVRVPDLYGVTVFGDTEAEALRRAQRIVLIVLRQLMIEGQPLPQPVADGDPWIELPSDWAEEPGRLSACPSAGHGVRSVISMLLDARKCQLGEHS